MAANAVAIPTMRSGSGNMDAVREAIFRREREVTELKDGELQALRDALAERDRELADAVRTATAFGEELADSAARSKERDAELKRHSDSFQLLKKQASSAESELAAAFSAVTTFEQKLTQEKNARLREVRALRAQYTTDTAALREELEEMSLLHANGTALEIEPTTSNADKATLRMELEEERVRTSEAHQELAEALQNRDALLQAMATNGNACAGIGVGGDIALDSGTPRSQEDDGGVSWEVTMLRSELVECVAASQRQMKEEADKLKLARGETRDLRIILEAEGLGNSVSSAPAAAALARRYPNTQDVASLVAQLDELRASVPELRMQNEMRSAEVQGLQQQVASFAQRTIDTEEYARQSWEQTEHLEASARQLKRENDVLRSSAAELHQCHSAAEAAAQRHGAGELAAEARNRLIIEEHEAHRASSAEALQQQAAELAAAPSPDEVADLRENVMRLSETVWEREEEVSMWKQRVRAAQQDASAAQQDVSTREQELESSVKALQERQSILEEEAEASRAEMSRLQEVAAQQTAMRQQGSPAQAFRIGALQEMSSAQGFRADKKDSESTATGALEGWRARSASSEVLGSKRDGPGCGGSPTSSPLDSLVFRGLNDEPSRGGAPSEPTAAPPSTSAALSPRLAAPDLPAATFATSTEAESGRNTPSRTLIGFRSVRKPSAGGESADALLSSGAKDWRQQEPQSEPASRGFQRQTSRELSRPEAGWGGRRVCHKLPDASDPLGDPSSTELKGSSRTPAGGAGIRGVEDRIEGAGFDVWRSGSNAAGERASSPGAVAFAADPPRSPRSFEPSRTDTPPAQAPSAAAADSLAESRASLRIASPAARPMSAAIASEPAEAVRSWKPSSPVGPTRGLAPAASLASPERPSEPVGSWRTSSTEASRVFSDKGDGSQNAAVDGRSPSEEGARAGLSPWGAAAAAERRASGSEPASATTEPSRSQATPLKVPTHAKGRENLLKSLRDAKRTLQGHIEAQPAAPAPEPAQAPQDTLSGAAERVAAWRSRQR